jgi:hypothetical protein
VSYIESAKYNMMEDSQRHGFHADTVQMPIDNMGASSKLFATSCSGTLGQDIAILDMKCFARGSSNFCSQLPG